MRITRGAALALDISSSKCCRRHSVVQWLYSANFWGTIFMRSPSAARKQSWVIVLAGAIVATIGTGLYAEMLAGWLVTLDQVAEFVIAHWRALPVPWLTFYGVSILLLNSIAVFSGCKDVPHTRSAREWALDFHYRCEATQYFTCVILLAALGLAHFSFRSESVPGDQTLVETSLRFTPCAGLALAGLVIWSVGSAIVLLRLPSTIPAPVSAPDAELLQQHLAAELERLAEMVERQHPPAERTSATVAVLSEAVQAIYQDVQSLLNRPTSPIPDDLYQAQMALDRSVSDLRATVASLQDSLRQLSEANGSLLPPDRSPRPSIAQSELSQELKKLLEQMPRR